MRMQGSGQGVCLTWLNTHCSLVALIFKGTALVVFPVPQPQPSQYSYSRECAVVLMKMERMQLLSN